jgi:uncharacterized protein (UPF0548 family)
MRTCHTGPVFSPFQPSRIDRALQQAACLPASYRAEIDTLGGPDRVLVPPGFDCDHTRTQIGHGIEAFRAARQAFLAWLQFDLGWVRVANPDAPIAPGQLVAVEAHALGLWSLNISRILYTIDEPARFGFAYATTSMHVERGEERFLIEFDPDSGAVYYDLLAVSQPASLLARLAYPYTRSQQRRFARDSHLRMKEIAGKPLNTST